MHKVAPNTQNFERTLFMDVKILFNLFPFQNQSPHEGRRSGQYFLQRFRSNFMRFKKIVAFC